MIDSIGTQIAIAIVTMVGSLIVYLLNALNNKLTQLNRDQTARAAVAAGLVDEVKTTLHANAASSIEKMDVLAKEDTLQKLREHTADESRKLDNLAKVTRATHTLVNSNMAIQLRLNRDMSRRLAEMTRDPNDVAASEFAARALVDHEAKQAEVDSQDGTDAEKRGAP